MPVGAEAAEAAASAGPSSAADALTVEDADPQHAPSLPNVSESSSSEEQSRVFLQQAKNGKVQLAPVSAEQPEHMQQDQRQSSERHTQQDHVERVDGQVLTGRVQRYNIQSGYGFIEVDDGGDNCFVHQSEIQSEGFSFFLTYACSCTHACFWRQDFVAFLKTL